MTNGAMDILLVEDSESDAEFFRFALKDFKPAVKVQVARDGVEALAAIFGGHYSPGMVPLSHPRLVVLDLHLPRVNGMEVLQRLRANQFTRSIPIVALSTSDERRDLAVGYQLGLNSYLIKPMAFEELAKMIESLVHYWLKYNQLPKV